ncbi:MAG: ABC transporter ATP-binding protein [Alphaproteobacteria bacterium]|jgi:ABC-2 type transport system ATP-binding protein|nr:ABC transporter ATP-binding protein [Alphaproteobacteria bacterium]MDP6602677.1 ABC transporter ATP-binding protein [Rhodospirillales bacterium]
MANTFEPENAVEVRGLAKVYAASGRNAPVTALDAIDLAVPRGALFGLLGPNGAGKSTLINILAGLVIKTAGKAHVWGIDIDDDPRMARAAIGVVPQELNIDTFFTPKEMLESQAGFYAVPRSERRTMEILRILSLDDRADVNPRSLSGGMRRRLLVAKAMVHDPPVLVLDEPTAGVDIELRRQLWDQVRALNRRGTTVLLTTHYLEEAESLCDRIAIIDHGRVVACDETDALLRRIDNKTMHVTLARPPDDPPALLAGHAVEFEAPNRLTVRYRPSATHAGEILDELRGAGLDIVELTTEETDLEDIFLQLTGARPETPPETLPEIPPVSAAAED